MSSANKTLAVQEAQAKVDEYSQFMDTVLRPELQEAQRLVTETQQEITEYQQLRRALSQPEQLPPSPVVDLGYETLFCPAKYHSADNDMKVFVDVGLGFHVEMNPKEAIEFIDKRVLFLQENPLNHRQKQYTTVHDHLQSSLNILEELDRVVKSEQSR